MKILSDTYKIEVTHDELLLIYDAMMKVLAEIPEKNTNEFRLKRDQCFEISVVLGKKDDFFERMRNI